MMKQREELSAMMKQREGVPTMSGRSSGFINVEVERKVSLIAKKDWTFDHDEAESRVLEAT
jgi:hypothetical protein